MLIDYQTFHWQLNGPLNIAYACLLVYGLFNILREKSLAIYFEDSQLRRKETFDFIVSKIYVDKRSRVR